MNHVQPVSVSNAAVPALARHTCLVSLLCETAHLLAASCTKASTALFCSCGAAPRAQMKRQTVNEAARMGADSFYTNSATIPVLSYPRAGEAWRRALTPWRAAHCLTGPADVVAAAAAQTSWLEGETWDRRRVTTISRRSTGRPAGFPHSCECFMHHFEMLN